MITGPKYKICKRLGSAVFEKCQTAKFAAAKENVKQRPRGQTSEFKRQLTEKQKMRYSYGITEKQLARYVGESMHAKGDPITHLMNRLESRLDNVVYRMGFAKTRRLARQMVSHGHLTVNGRKVTIPSYKIDAKDVVAVRKGSQVSPLFAQLAEGTHAEVTPSWLTVDIKELSGVKNAEPLSTKSDFVFDPVQVLQYYSR
jgi:small subunit ribosomal protein S4